MVQARPVTSFVSENLKGELCQFLAYNAAIREVTNFAGVEAVQSTVRSSPVIKDNTIILGFGLIIPGESSVAENVASDLWMCDRSVYWLLIQCVYQE